MENIELSDCVYEHISKTFYYGIFGDFKLVIDQKTGYFNATKLCEHGGKRFKEWKDLERSKRLIEYYQNRYQNSGIGLTYNVSGGEIGDKIEKQYIGTYASQELILDIASWVSFEFYDMCNTIIVKYGINRYKSLSLKMLQKKVKEADEKVVQVTLEEIKVKDEQIDELKTITLRQEQYMRSLGISLEEVKDQNEELLDDNKCLKKKANNIQRKLGIAVENCSPSGSPPHEVQHETIQNELKRNGLRKLTETLVPKERFILLKRNDPDYLPYHVIRAQDVYIKRKLKTEQLHFPNLEVILNFKCTSNSKTYYNRTKEILKEKGVMCKHNDIDLEDSGLTEQDLIDELKAINDAKRDV